MPHSFVPKLNPHRHLTPAEIQRRDILSAYLDNCSEDDLIEDVLLPLFRELGFERITVVGHEDKALEYGKDMWMRYRLPTGHILYFGIQAKKGKLDAAAASKGDSSNIAAIWNQVQMMLQHGVFDPELNQRKLVDHVYIVAGGEITKQAKNLLDGNLDSIKRSRAMFLDRNDILDLFVVTDPPLPKGALPAPITEIDGGTF